MGRIHAKPKMALILCNLVMAGLCIISIAEVVRRMGGHDAMEISAFISLFVLIGFLTALQAHGTWGESESSSAIAGLLFGAMAILTGLSAIISLLTLHHLRWAGDQMTLIAATIFASFACVANLKRNTENVTPPAQGICAACGYDLRATPGRCPECGYVPENLSSRG